MPFHLTGEFGTLVQTAVPAAIRPRRRIVGPGCNELIQLTGRLILAGITTKPPESFMYDRHPAFGFA